MSESASSNAWMRSCERLPYSFEAGAFDAVHMMITFISELLVGPDCPLAKILMRMANAAGFRLMEKQGNFFSYALVFEK